MRSLVKATALLLSLLMMAATAAAEDTLESVLATAAGQVNVAIEYSEVRHLQLLSEPWQAEGQMFVTPNLFVIEQILPQRQLLTASKQRYRLFIPEKNIRRTGMLTSPMAQKSFGLFRPLMSGDRAALEKAFDIAFRVEGQRWHIELKPKRASTVYYKRIIVEGASGKPADQMKTELDDGDYSEWSFKQQPFTSKLEERINALMVEAKGE